MSVCLRLFSLVISVIEQLIVQLNNKVHGECNVKFSVAQQLKLDYD